ncbi:MAG: glucose-6-phosphate dehydrogenase assembly protein OpcA [Methylococcales bacterium]
MKAKIFLNKIVAPRPKRVSIADIDVALDRLWSQFNQDIISSGFTVMRACMSNLIIYCNSMEEATAIGDDIPAIVDTHPARVLLLIGEGKPSDGRIEALVGIYYTAMSGGWQVCAERIDVIATPLTTDRLPSVARSNLIGDLPTTLWWASRQPPPEAGELFFQLAELSNQIIYDNMGWINPFKGVVAMTRWVAAQQDSRIVHNLAWRKVAIWRKLISQVLDPQVAPDALSSLHLIEINHGPHALAMVWLLVGWLASQLKWQSLDGKRLSDSELVWRFRNSNHSEIKIIVKRRPEGDPLIYQLGFDWMNAKHPGRIGFERLDSDRIGIVEALSTIPPRIIAAQIPARSTLVSAQLAQRNRDKVFENALKSCNAMTAVFQQ